MRDKTFFLSDLCGREGDHTRHHGADGFLSDLCGREGMGDATMFFG